MTAIGLSDQSMFEVVSNEQFAATGAALDFSAVVTAVRERSTASGSGVQ